MMTTVESSTELDLSFRNVAVVNYAYSNSSSYMVMVNVLSKVLNVEPDDINIASEALNLSLPSLEFSNGESSVVLFGNVAFPSDVWLKDRIVIRECKLKVSILSEIVDWFDTNVLNPTEDPSSLEYYDKLLTEHNFFKIHSRSKVSVFVSSEKHPCVPEDDNENDSNSEFDGAPTITSDSTLSTTNFDFPKSSQDFAHLAKQHSNTSSNSGNKISSFSSNIISSRKRFLAFLTNNDSNSAQNKNNSLMSKSSIKFNNNPKHNNLLDGASLLSSSPTKTINEEEVHKQQSLNSILSKSRIYNKLKKNRESVSSTQSSSTNNSNLSRRTSTSTDASAITTDSRRPHLSPIIDTIERKHTNTNESISRKVKPLPSPLISVDGRRENRELKFSYYCQLGRLLRLVENLIDFVNKDLTAKNSDNNKILQYLDFLKQKVFKFVLIDINQMILDYAQLRAYKICKTL